MTVLFVDGTVSKPLKKTLRSWKRALKTKRGKGKK